jgi:restriction system protein
MAIPDFQSLMLPLLRLANDGKEHSISEWRDSLALQLKLTEKERKELLPSGRQSLFTNRVAWAVAHMKKAVLLQNLARGRYSISARGQQVLAANPDFINLKFLRQYPEYRQPASDSKQGDDPEPGRNDPRAPEQTPEETLESSYQSLRSALAQDLLSHVKQESPRFFEELVIDLLVAMGYGGSRRDAGEAVGQSGDGGIDGIIKEDKLGLDAIYIQAKRWDNIVGRPIVQAFAGSLEGQRARKGVLITTSQFSKDALDYVGKIEKKIVLIDGEQLAQLMIDHGIGVTEVATYVIKRVDQDYFSEE